MLLSQATPKSVVEPSKATMQKSNHRIMLHINGCISPGHLSPDAATTTVSEQPLTRGAQVQGSSLQRIDKSQVLPIRLVHVHVIEPEDPAARVERVILAIAGGLLEQPSSDLVLSVEVEADDETHGGGDEPKGRHEGPGQYVPRLVLFLPESVIVLSVSVGGVRRHHAYSGEIMLATDAATMQVDITHSFLVYPTVVVPAQESPRR